MLSVGLSVLKKKLKFQKLKNILLINIINLI